MASEGTSYDEPDGRRSNAILVAVSVFVISLVGFFRIPFLPTMGAEIGMSNTALAAVTTLFALGRLLTDLPAGRLVDRQHPFRLMAWSAVAAAVGCVAFAVAQEAIIIYIAAFLLGIASAVSNTTGLHYFSTNASAERRGTSISVYSSTLLVGQAVGPPIAAALAVFGSWRTAHLNAVAGLFVLTLLLVVLSRGVRQRPPTMQPASGGGDDQLPSNHAARSLLFIIPFFMFGVFGATVHTMVPIVGGELSISAASIGVALGLGGLFRLASILGGGQISDRLGRKAALVPALLVSAVGVGILAAASNYGYWLASIVAISIGSIAISVTATMISDLSTPGRTGRSLGPWRFAGDVGYVLVPLAVGVAFDAVGKAATLFPLAVILIILGIASALMLPETRQPKRRLGP